jgi:AraC family transcriptional regulator, positive regulator of tynA and feaB
LTKLAADWKTGTPSSLDLNGVEEAQRAALWSRAARTFFPGLTVRELRPNPAIGSIQGTPFGSGHLWTILSPPLQVSYDPETVSDGSQQTFSVMLQLEGATIARQERRSCRLRAHDFCVIDGLSPFGLEVDSPTSHVMFLQIPRHAVLSRHSYLEKQTAEIFDADDGGSGLLRNMMLNVLNMVPFLKNEQRECALSAIAHLLGAPTPAADFICEIGVRARTALAYIESQIADPALSAVRVAQHQGISRRRLDAILLKTAGSSLASQIWMRRLSQAADDLIDPRHARRTVTQIAFAVGFEDSAHFTRAFKRRYHLTPREWRNRYRKGAPDEASAPGMPQ